MSSLFFILFNSLVHELTEISEAFKKINYCYHSSEPFVVGGQPDDDRIFVQERVERAPDYTEGEQE